MSHGGGIDLRNYGNDMVDAKIVEKIIQTFFENFDYILCFIEEEIDKLTIDVLQSFFCMFINKNHYEVVITFLTNLIRLNEEVLHISFSLISSYFFNNIFFYMIINNCGYLKC